VACCSGSDGCGERGVCEVSVVDLLAVPLADLWEPLRELFERPDVLKLGFRFKQDLLYLSSTFAAELGGDAGFDKVRARWSDHGRHNFLSFRQNLEIAKLIG
jgi:uncharacterized protein